jgi:hypothetical protein
MAMTPEDPMRFIRLHMTVTGQPAAATYSTLGVAVSGLLPTTTVSKWEVNDVPSFEGSWSCVDDGGDTAVTFAARLAPGSLAAAELRSLIDDTVATVSGLFEGNVRVDDVVIQAHPAGNETATAA